MADEQDFAALPELDNPAPEASAEAPETEELETEGQQPDADGDAEGGDGEGEGSDLSTIEIDGIEYQVPKALEGAFLRNKDYTQKSQANAERARTLETREAEIEERAKATDEELDMRATLKGVEKQLADYEKLTPEDWAFHESNDPLGVQRHWRTFQLLQQEKARLASTLTEKQNARAQSAQQDLAKRVEETNAFAQKNIPNFKPELTDKLIAFAGELGVPETALKANWSPTFYKLLHRAWIGEQTLKTPVKPAPKTEAPAQPLKTIAAKSNPKPTGLDDRLSADEWFKRRNAQVRKAG